MMPVYIKVRAPLAGLGKVSIELTREFRKLHPERKLSILRQVAMAIRDEDKRAATENINLIKAEDAANAEGIRRTA